MLQYGIIISIVLKLVILMDIKYSLFIVLVHQGNGLFKEMVCSLMNRISQFDKSSVLKNIGKIHWLVTVDKKQYSVKMSAQRMLLLGRTQKCACCGLKGQYFWLEHSGCLPPHFNLYGIRKRKEVLLTADHIQPRSLGGKTTQENLQLLCFTCNKAKKNLVITLPQLRKLRGVKNA